MNTIQRVLLILYPATVWVSVVFFTPHTTTVHGGGLSASRMDFYPFWTSHEKFDPLSRIDCGFIWIEIAMISICFISLILAFQGKTKHTRKAKPTDQVIENDDVI